MIKQLLSTINKPWFSQIAQKMAGGMKVLDKIMFLNHRAEFETNKDLYETRERRILDTIAMKKEPDKVPAVGIAMNFFPAKYSGITCEEMMFDAKKTSASILKVNKDFNFDSTFPSVMYLGKFMKSSAVNLFKLPGRDIDPNSCYQFHEIERLKQVEYDDFLNGGLEYLMEVLAPRISGIFRKNLITRYVHFGKVILEIMIFAKTILPILSKLKERGDHNIFGGIAFPPYDMMSFTFRTLNGLARDMIKKQVRQKLIDVCERMEPYLTSFWNLIPHATGNPGIWFPSERAFSLSPRQFETFYWPTLKKMIIRFVKAGHIPFLVWEQDVTHLVHYLLELPRSISHRCVFLCDNSDIIKVNRILDGHMCIHGNIPLSTMCVGTPKDVEKYCDKIFPELKPGGGFMLSPALGIPDEAKPENVHAYINYAEKHGWY